MLKIFFKFKEQNIKTAMEYTFNFFMMVFSGVIMRGLMLAGAFVIFRNVPDIAGWKEGEVYLIMSFMFISEGLCTILFNGIWSLSMQVFNGEFDVILLRPVSPFFQVVTSEVGIQGIGATAIGLVALFLSLSSLNLLNIKSILLCLLFIVTGTVFRLATNIISGSSIFWMKSYRSDPMFFVYSFGENARYPVSIYPGWMKFILLFIIPFGFIGYVPALILRGENALILTLLSVLFCGAFFLFSRFFFYQGIKKYESMGM